MHHKGIERGKALKHFPRGIVYDETYPRAVQRLHMCQGRQSSSGTIGARWQIFFAFHLIQLFKKRDLSKRNWQLFIQPKYITSK